MSVMTAEGYRAWVMNTRTPRRLLKAALRNHIVLDLPVPDAYATALARLAAEPRPSAALIAASLQLGEMVFADLRAQLLTTTY